MALLQVAIVFATAFLVTFCTVPLSRKIAVVLGAIDQPGYRRVNKGPVPRCGGIALYLGLCAAFLVAYVGLRFFGWQLRDLYTLNGINYIELFVGITVMFAVGLVDDVTRLSPKMKLLGQIIAACIVVASGVSIGMVHTAFASTGGYYALGWLDFPLTVAYLVVFVNITNLIDGLDGLASGLVAIACSGLLFLVWQRGSMTMALVCVAVIGVCLAFLRYNFFPASVFMGDSGSHLLGLMVGIIAVSGVARAQGVVVMLAPLVIAGVPVLDTVSAVIRRMRNHERIDHADFGHIHHRLMRAGLSQKRSVAVLWTCSACLAGAGCVIGSFSGPIQVVVIVGLGLALFAVISHFGLFKPVLRHHYDNKGKSGPRLPHSQGKQVK